MAAAKGRSRVRFTPELWAKWLARDEVDTQTNILANGLNDFRVKCAQFEKRSQSARKKYWENDP